MKKRILALARDRGSMQAIAPVIVALVASDRHNVTSLAMRESSAIAAASGIHASLMDEAEFAADSARYMHALLDSYRPDLILMGFGPARGPAPETPEQYAIIEAQARSIPTLAVQDYWGMYVERLSRDAGSLADDLLPDRLCVLDRRAHADLEAFGVPAKRMAVTHNPWLDKLAAQASPIKVSARDRAGDGMTILFASQPLASMQKVRRWPYDQYVMFEQLLAAMPEDASGGGRSTIYICAHPSEDLSRWETLLTQAMRQDVHVELCRERRMDLLREADYLVTSHSTLAYEALYFGTPCISLRPANEEVMRLWIDDAGLSRIFRDATALRQFFATSDPGVERQRMLQLKRTLSAEGLFFSDGKATQRVVAEVEKLLDL